MREIYCRKQSSSDPAKENVRERERGRAHALACERETASETARARERFTQIRSKTEIYTYNTHVYESDFAGSHASARCWYESDGGERRRACERERESGRERARERMTGEGIENERETMSYTHA